MREGGEMRASVQGNCLTVVPFYFFSPLFVSLLLVYTGIVDSYVYVYICPF
jgi:hypothetical protein